MKLYPPQTAPRDDTLILGHFSGRTGLLAAVWDGIGKHWAVAEVKVIESDEHVEPGWIYRYFDNKEYLANELLGWLPIPAISPTPR